MRQDPIKYQVLDLAKHVFEMSAQITAFHCFTKFTINW